MITELNLPVVRVLETEQTLSELADLAQRWINKRSLPVTTEATLLLGPIDCVLTEYLDTILGSLYCTVLHCSRLLHCTAEKSRPVPKAVYTNVAQNTSDNIACLCRCPSRRCTATTASQASPAL